MDSFIKSLTPAQIRALNDLKPVETKIQRMYFF